MVNMNTKNCYDLGKDLGRFIEASSVALSSYCIHRLAPPDDPFVGPIPSTSLCPIIVELGSLANIATTYLFDYICSDNILHSTGYTLGNASCHEECDNE